MDSQLSHSGSITTDELASPSPLTIISTHSEGHTSNPTIQDFSETVISAENRKRKMVPNNLVVTDDFENQCNGDDGEVDGKDVVDDEDNEEVEEDEEDKLLKKVDATAGDSIHAPVASGKLPAPFPKDSCDSSGDFRTQLAALWEAGIAYVNSTEELEKSHKTLADSYSRLQSKFEDARKQVQCFSYEIRRSKMVQSMLLTRIVGLDNVKDGLRKRHAAEKRLWEDKHAGEKLELERKIYGLEAELSEQKATVSKLMMALEKDQEI